MRESISPAARLEATLMYLSTGCSYSALQYSTRISKPSLSAIIPDTCKAIYDVLKDPYLKTPQTAEEWMRVAERFSKKWNFPNCIGAVDGKHILIRPPPDSGSFYYNYKGSHSIVLMAVSNADSNLYVNVGHNGRVLDGGVWDTCSLNQHIEAGSADMPDDEILSNSSKVLPYVIVADDAFPLKRHIMKPFSH
ncbi:uncharacterized protein LOC135218849 [Macrobrachium nipponense]|uniref:uncharacterized protein LOC135218849 n=1 Tax=Macrobrachium nipponense TaxID=159736 RepID=UPI0030C85612